jgi:hypothetical protein
MSDAPLGFLHRTFWTVPTQWAPVQKEERHFPLYQGYSCKRRSTYQNACLVIDVIKPPLDHSQRKEK